MDTTTAAKTIKTLTRQVDKTTPKKNRVTDTKVSRDYAPPHELRAELAERIREWSRSIIQRLLASYIRR